MQLPVLLACLALQDPQPVREVLAIEVSTKPLINLVWLGAVVMLLAGFLSTLRRVLDLRRERQTVRAEA